MPQSLYRIVPIVCALGLAPAGCTIARPHPTPADPAVVQLPFFDSGFPHLCVEQVDGVTVPASTNRLELAAGVYEVVLSCNYASQFVNPETFGRVRLRFDAQSGERYRVRTRPQRGRCAMWLEHEATGAVASERVE